MELPGTESFAPTFMAGLLGSTGGLCVSSARLGLRDLLRRLWRR